MKSSNFKLLNNVRLLQQCWSKEKSTNSSTLKPASQISPDQSARYCLDLVRYKSSGCQCEFIINKITPFF